MATKSTRRHKKPEAEDGREEAHEAQKKGPRVRRAGDFVVTYTLRVSPFGYVLALLESPRALPHAGALIRGGEVTGFDERAKIGDGHNLPRPMPRRASRWAISRRPRLRIGDREVDNFGAAMAEIFERADDVGGVFDGRHGLICGDGFDGPQARRRPGA